MKNDEKRMDKLRKVRVVRIHELTEEELEAIVNAEIPIELRHETKDIKE